MKIKAAAAFFTVLIVLLAPGCGDVATDDALGTTQQAVMDSPDQPTAGGGDPPPLIYEEPDPTPSDPVGPPEDEGPGWTPPDDAFFCEPNTCESPCDFLSLGELLQCIGCAGSPGVGACARCTSAMVGAATCQSGFQQCLYQRLPDPPTEDTCCLADDPPSQCWDCCDFPDNYEANFAAACSYCQDLHD